jgi:hypothetical protein
MISSHSGSQPLKTVWLGDVYPEKFYDHYESNLRDSLCQLTETTKHDLGKIKSKLVELGVIVQQPTFESMDLYISDNKLTKPPICPRDWAITLGDTLYITPQYESGIQPWQWAIDEHIKAGSNVCVLNRFCDNPDPHCYMNYPSVVRVGKDIYVDYPKDAGIIEKNMSVVCSELSKNYRVHVTHTNDHSDGVFCPVQPGQIFSTHYRKTYSHTFPEWDVFFLKDTTKQNNSQFRRWQRPDHYLPYYSDALASYALDWLGNSNETIFEVNMLVVDEKNVICIAENDAACRKLESIGITPHVMNFKTRGFWDGGLHCITLDIHRLGECIDYWPGRGPNGIYYYNVH